MLPRYHGIEGVESMDMCYFGKSNMAMENGNGNERLNQQQPSIVFL